MDKRQSDIKIIFVIGSMKEMDKPAKVSYEYKRWPPIDREIIAAMEMTYTQKTTVTPKFFDKDGHPTKVDGAPAWFADNTDVISLEPASDGLSCVIKSVGAIGTANITMQADAKIGEGTSDLFGTLSINVIAGEATQVTLEASTPEENE